MNIAPFSISLLLLFATPNLLATTPAEIQSLIKQLAADSNEDRENAYQSLWTLGQPALKEIQKQTASNDPEISLKCEELSKLIELDIQPNTPEEIIVLVKSILESNDVTFISETLGTLAEKEPKRAWQLANSKLKKLAPQNNIFPRIQNILRTKAIDALKEKKVDEIPKLYQGMMQEAQLRADIAALARINKWDLNKLGWKDSELDLVKYESAMQSGDIKNAELFLKKTKLPNQDFRLAFLKSDLDAMLTYWNPSNQDNAKKGWTNPTLRTATAETESILTPYIAGDLTKVEQARKTILTGSKSSYAKLNAIPYGSLSEGLEFLSLSYTKVLPDALSISPSNEIAKYFCVKEANAENLLEKVKSQQLSPLQLLIISYYLCSKNEIDASRETIQTLIKTISKEPKDPKNTISLNNIPHNNTNVSDSLFVLLLMEEFEKAKFTQFEYPTDISIDIVEKLHPDWPTIKKWQATFEFLGKIPNKELGSQIETEVINALKTNKIIEDKGEFLNSYFSEFATGFYPARILRIIKSSDLLDFVPDDKIIELAYAFAIAGESEAAEKLVENFNDESQPIRLAIRSGILKEIGKDQNAQEILTYIQNIGRADEAFASEILLGLSLFKRNAETLPEARILAFGRENPQLNIFSVAAIAENLIATHPTWRQALNWQILNAHIYGFNFLIMQQGSFSFFEFSENYAKMDALQLLTAVQEKKFDQAKIWLKHIISKNIKSAFYTEVLIPELEKLSGGKPFANQLYKALKSNWERELKLWPKDASLKNEIAWQMQSCNRDLDTAHQLVSQAIELLPKCEAFIDTLCVIELKLGNTAKAKALDEEIHKINPFSRESKLRMKGYNK